VIEKLRVSRTPFREAIRILAKGGLVEIKPYHGFFVRSFSRSETADLYKLYKRLECFAVELAVPQMSDRDIRRFENIGSFPATRTMDIPERERSQGTNKQK
jgi:DNA-binding GntR family transcriptional regulator